jgi:glycerol-3-phosphate dehydrogenase
MTAQESLPGAETSDFKGFSERFMTESPLPLAATTTRLLRIYGTRASALLDVAAQDPELALVFDTETGAIAAEVLMSFQQEMAETLADCLLRRTMVGMNSLAGVGADEAAAMIARKYLGWSHNRAAEEIAAYRKYIERFHPRKLVRE